MSAHVAQLKAFAETLGEPFPAQEAIAASIGPLVLKYNVLVLASHGGTTETVAHRLSRPEEEITEIRDELIAAYGTRNMAAVINQAILKRHLVVEAAKEPALEVSERDRLILQLFAQGYHNSEIADELLGASAPGKGRKRGNAVLNYTRAIFKRMGASGRTHSVRRSYELGIFALTGTTERQDGTA